VLVSAGDEQRAYVIFGSRRLAVWQIFNIVEDGRFSKPPIHVQDEIAILAVAPERLVPLSFALGIVVDDAIDDLPVSVIAVGALQPRRSFPLKSETNPSGGVLSVAHTGRPSSNPTRESRMARRVIMINLRW
jgi:hypothetical protein